MEYDYRAIIEQVKIGIVHQLYSDGLISAAQYSHVEQALIKEYSRKEDCPCNSQG